MKKHYGTIKYHGYIIEGRGLYFELYHPDGLIGSFSTCKDAKTFVDKEIKEADTKWNNAVLAEYEF